MSYFLFIVAAYRAAGQFSGMHTIVYYKHTVYRYILDAFGVHSRFYQVFVGLHIINVEHQHICTVAFLY